MNFAKETGIVKPTVPALSTRGAKDTGTVKPSGTNTSTKGGGGGTKK